MEFQSFLRNAEFRGYEKDVLKKVYNKLHAEDNVRTINYV